VWRPYARVVASILPADARVLSIGVNPKALGYSTLPDGLDDEWLSDRIERGNAALREAGGRPAASRCSSSTATRC
jgi:hypothetical protein